jgi:hypothetical protein
LPFALADAPIAGDRIRGGEYHIKTSESVKIHGQDRSRRGLSAARTRGRNNCRMVLDRVAVDHADDPPAVLVRRLRAEADINLPTIPDESVENDPKRTCLRVQKLPFLRELAYGLRVGS